MTDIEADRYILRLSCADQKGIVAAVTRTIVDFDGNITEARQFDDIHSGRFFMRVVFGTPAGRLDAAEFGQRLQQSASFKNLDFKLVPHPARKRILIALSKWDHCMADLVYRNRTGELKADIVGIVSNHPESALNIRVSDQIPYHHLPITKDTKPEQEAAFRQVIEESGADLVILARYMQILSNDFSRYLEGRCINIHHSFLPGFKGARPYHQAFERGVKMIGATAHYVTADLDEGPIIHQDVEWITHADMPGKLIEKGRDIERRVLSEAVKLHIEERVFLNEAKTVVFKD